MTCAQAESEFLRHERGEPTSEGFRAHLEACAACARAFRDFADAGRLLRELPAVRLERDLVAPVRSARTRRAVGWQTRAWLAPGLAVAAVVALVAIGLVRVLPHGSSPAQTASAPPTRDRAVAAGATRDPEVAPTVPSAEPAPSNSTSAKAGEARPAPAAPDPGEERGVAAVRTAPGPRRARSVDEREAVSLSIAPALDGAPGEPDRYAGVGGAGARMGALLREHLTGDRGGLGGAMGPSGDAGSRGAAGAPGAAGPAGGRGGAFGGGGFGGASEPSCLAETADACGLAQQAPAAQAGASIPKGASEGVARDTEPQVYDFDFREAPVSEALREISARTGTEVGIPEALTSRPPVTVRMEGVTARAALSRVCRAAGFRLQLRSDGTLVVRRGPSPGPTATRP